MADITQPNLTDASLDGGADAERASSVRAFSISDFCKLYGIGRTHTYEEIAAGRLRALKSGRRTLITREAADAWLATLPELNTNITEKM